MIDSPMPMTDWEKQNKKRKEAMKKRLTSLGKDNPIVARAVKNQEPPQEDMKWKNWNVVDELVSAARREYFDKEGALMSKCIANLATALQKLSGTKGLDTSTVKDNNSELEEDY